MASFHAGMHSFSVLYVHLAEAMNNDPIIKELTSFISSLLEGFYCAYPVSGSSG